MIKNCRSCKSTKLLDILSLGNQYLSEFVEGDQKPERYPLEVILCQECNLLQLRHTAPPKSLYTNNYGYRSGINQTMKDHLKGIADKADELALPLPKEIVVDIGCNDGTLLKSYEPEWIMRAGFDPVGKFAEYFKDTDIIFTNDYFSKKSYFDRFQRKAKVITAISMFYDLDNPNAFVNDLAEVLEDDGIIIIQQNYLVGMLFQNALDNIVHEHLEYYSLLSLEKLLKRHELIVFDVELNDLNGGSFRTYICKEGKREINASVLKLRESEAKLGLDKKEIYQDFAKRIENIKKELKSFIEQKNQEGKTVYVYGASTRGNTLLQYCELDNRLLKAAVERNPEKFGKKIASISLPIISEEQARKEKPDFMLVLPWHFKKEFLEREKDYLNAGGCLIFPLPKMEAVYG